MSRFVRPPLHPYVYNWKTKAYEWLSQEEYQQRREQQHKAEAAGNTYNAQAEEADTETPTLDRIPISKGEMVNTPAREQYVQQILTTDKELQTDQVEGVDTVIQQQEQEAATLLSPTIPPTTEPDADTQQYEPPTEEDLRTAEQLTKQATPVTTSASKVITPKELHNTATTYLSQPDLDQGKYNSQH